MKIILNEAVCRECGTRITSFGRYNLTWCSCGAIFVDGGLHYLRRGGRGYPGSFIDQAVLDTGGVSYT